MNATGWGGAVVLWCAVAFAQAPQEAPDQPLGLDRVFLRYTSPDTGGGAHPQFVFERELAFAARLEALADKEFQPEPGAMYAERHLRGALESQIAETLLGSHEVEPAVGVKELGVRIRAARSSLLQRVGGVLALNRAARAEGIGPKELNRLLERRARASLYLDRMVAPMLAPSETELRVAYRTTSTPFSGQPYEQVAPRMRRWYVARRLRSAVLAFYEGARNRVHVVLANE